MISPIRFPGRDSTMALAGWRFARPVILSCLLLAVVSIGGCRRIHVPVPVPHVRQSHPGGTLTGPVAGLPLIVVFDGPAAEARDWVQVYTVSRFFHRGVPNETGSPADLLYAALAPSLKERGYLPDRADSAVGGRARLRIAFVRLRCEWFPPQEFIETIRPHRRGRIHASMDIEARLPGGGHVRFERTIDTEAYPGEEYAKMEVLMSEVFAEFADDVLDRLPPAGEMHP